MSYAPDRLTRKAQVATTRPPRNMGPRSYNLGRLKWSVDWFGRSRELLYAVAIAVFTSCATYRLLDPTFRDSQRIAAREGQRDSVLNQAVMQRVRQNVELTPDEKRAFEKSAQIQQEQSIAAGEASTTAAEIRSVADKLGFVSFAAIVILFLLPTSLHDVTDSEATMIPAELHDEARRAWHDYAQALIVAFNLAPGSLVDASWLERTLSDGDEGSVGGFISYLQHQTAELKIVKFIGER